LSIELINQHAAIEMAAENLEPAPPRASDKIHAPACFA